MSHSSVDEALRVLKKIEGLAELQRIANEKGIQRIRPIAAIVTKETEKFWAAKAMEMSKNTLETYVKDYRLEFLPREKIKPVKFSATQNNKPEAEIAVSEAKIKVSMELSMETIEALKARKGDQDWDAFIMELLNKSEVQNKSEIQKPPTEKPPSVINAKRYIPKKIKKYVAHKSGGLCRFPGCAKKGDIFHHTQRFAIKREHNPDKLVLLCKNHERIVHLGLVAREHEDTREWKIQKQRATGIFNLEDLFIDKTVNAYRA